jgi:hypothetical protein
MILAAGSLRASGPEITVLDVAAPATVLAEHAAAEELTALRW